MTDKTSLIRNLVPKSYHFDGYNKLNCPNLRERAFFSDNTIPMGEYYLTTRLTRDSLFLEFSSICESGKIAFKPYQLAFETYVSKLKKAIQEGSDFITFEILPQYWDEHIYCLNCSKNNYDCVQIRKNRPKVIMAAVSFDTSEVKEALAMYFEIIKKPNGGINNMKKANNVFGMNFELGLSKDPNIASTLMGVAVKNPNTKNWYTFDAARNTRKNLASFKMGELPIMLLPTKVLAKGDLIKLDGQYYYVKEVKADCMTLIGAADGIIREMLPEESLIPGMQMYTKVVAFDAKSLMDNSTNQSLSGNVMAAICMMQWAKGNKDEFSLDNISDDSFNGLGAYLPIALAAGGNFGNMFAGENGNIDLPMLMALGAGGESDANGITQMMVLSQLLGGNSTFGAVAPVQFEGSVVVCEKCGAEYSEGTNFCSKCGGKTKPIEKSEVFCANCKVKYPEGTNFCPKCGGKTVIVTSTCPKCGVSLMEGAEFCHKCGAKVVADACPKCGRTINGDDCFCPGCGTSLTGEAEKTVEAVVAETENIAEKPAEK